MRAQKKPGVKTQGFGMISTGGRGARVYPCPEWAPIIMIAMIILDWAGVGRIGGGLCATESREVNVDIARMVFVPVPGVIPRSAANDVICKSLEIERQPGGLKEISRW